MANFVEIDVEMEDWLYFFLEVNKELGYDPDYTFRIPIDASFLEEYRQALQVVERFQRYTQDEVRKLRYG